VSRLKHMRSDSILDISFFSSILILCNGEFRERITQITKVTWLLPANCMAHVTRGG